MKIHLCFATPFVLPVFFYWWFLALRWVAGMPSPDADENMSMLMGASFLGVVVGGFWVLMAAQKEAPRLTLTIGSTKGEDQ